MAATRLHAEMGDSDSNRLRLKLPGESWQLETLHKQSLRLLLKASLVHSQRTDDLH